MIEDPHLLHPHCSPGKVNGTGKEIEVTRKEKSTLCAPLHEENLKTHNKQQNEKMGVQVKVHGARGKHKKENCVWVRKSQERVEESVTTPENELTNKTPTNAMHSSPPSYLALLGSDKSSYTI